MFAKLYETEKYGQILVKLDANDDANPEIRFYFEPEGSGVCSFATSFKDDEKGWDSAEKVFEQADEAFATNTVAIICKKLVGVSPQAPGEEG